MSKQKTSKTVADDATRKEEEKPTKPSARLEALKGKKYFKRGGKV